MKVPRIIFGIMATLVVPHASGQIVLTLQDAVQQAMDAHPLVRADAQRIVTADALTQQAGLRPNPRLFVQSENWNFTGSPTQPIASVFTDQFLYASQSLETAGKRQRRVDLAQQNVQLTQLDHEILRRQIEFRVRLAYWNAAGAQRVLDLLRENQLNLQQATAFHEIQLREGAIAEADVLRVRLEGDRGAVSVEDAAREAGAARIALLREMGSDSFPEIRFADSLDIVPDPPLVNIDSALNARADLRQARQVVEQTRAALRLQHAIARPDVEVLSGYKRTSGYNTLIWGVQVNLPFFNKNQGNIAAATSEVSAAESRVKVVEARIRAEIEGAVLDVESRRRRLSSLVTDALSRADESVSVARAAYREGGTDLLRLLDAERIHIELEVANARMRMEYRQSLASLELALGVSQ
ncbi:MAG: TolC family protein [Acidobacteriota bacterium]